MIEQIKKKLSQSRFPLIIFCFMLVYKACCHMTQTYTLDMAEFITLPNKLDELLKLSLKFVLKLSLGSQCCPSAGTGVPLFLSCRCTLCAWCVSGCWCQNDSGETDVTYGFIFLLTVKYTNKILFQWTKCVWGGGSFWLHNISFS